MFSTQLANFLVVIACCASQLVRCNAGHEVFVVGKGKPCNMSSKHHPAENPMLGMDGNTNDTYSPGLRCLHLNVSDPMPWWMVDMLQTYLIYGARVWNRRDANNYYRFTHISIGVTSNPSVWTTFSTDLFDLCMYWPGVPTAADNPINFTCSRPIAGRYLAVYKNLTGLSISNKPLHFCEVDILAFTKQMPLFFKKTVPSFSPSSSSLLQSASPTELDIHCVFQCSVLPDCLFVLVRAGSSPNCWLFGSFSIHDSFISVYNSSGANFLFVYC